MVALSLCCCVRDSSSCGEEGQIFVVVAQDSHRGGFSCCRARVLGLRVSSCSARVELLRGTWHLPRQGIELVSPYCQADSCLLYPKQSPFLKFLDGHRANFIAPISPKPKTLHSRDKHRIEA